MKVLKIILISLGSLIALVVLLNVIFFFGMTQKPAKPFEVNSPNLDKKILIATQGSNFKKSLVSNIIENIKEKSVYIKVIDVGTLPEIQKDRWNAVVIINSIQMGKFAKGVDEFLSKTDDNDNMILLNLGSATNEALEKYSIDTISSASKKDNIDNLSKKILEKINPFL